MHSAIVPGKKPNARLYDHVAQESGSMARVLRLGTCIVHKVAVENAAGALQHVRLESLHINSEEGHILMHHRIHPLSRHFDVLKVSIDFQTPVKWVRNSGKL